MYYYQNYIINIVHTMDTLYTKSSDAKNSFKEHFLLVQWLIQEPDQSKLYIWTIQTGFVSQLHSK